MLLLLRHMNSNASQDISGPESSHPLIHTGKSLITSMAEIVSTRAKQIFPKLAEGSALVWFGAVCAVLAVSWLSFFAWELLKLNPSLQSTASGVVGGVFLLASAALIAGGKTRAKNAFKPVEEATLDTRPDETSVKTELVTFSEDLGRAAKEALDPSKILRDNAGKIASAATVLAALAGFNVPSHNHNNS